jgi:polyphosphate kinase 2
MQDWVKRERLRVIVVFEGGDAAGKGGTIRAITERVSPRVFRLVALPAPSDREKTQMYIQRYFHHFPAAGEIVIFDRSWYNRAGVESVMGFCTREEQRDRFLQLVPLFENQIMEGGIILVKFWLDVCQEEQERRFEQRIKDPVRQWKLSPMDTESYKRWYEYSHARDLMLEKTDTKESPWHIIRSDDKKKPGSIASPIFLVLFPIRKYPTRTSNCRGERSKINTMIRNLSRDGISYRKVLDSCRSSLRSPEDSVASKSTQSNTHAPVSREAE